MQQCVCVLMVRPLRAASGCLMDGLFLSVCVCTGRLPFGLFWSSGCLQLSDSDCLDVTVQHTSDINNKLINIQTVQVYICHLLHFMSNKFVKNTYSISCLELRPIHAFHLMNTPLHDECTHFYSLYSWRYEHRHVPHMCTTKTIKQ